MGYLDRDKKKLEELRQLVSKLLSIDPYANFPGPKIEATQEDIHDEVELIEAYRALFKAIENSPLTPGVGFHADDLIPEVQNAISYLSVVESFDDPSDPVKVPVYREALGNISSHYRNTVFRNKLTNFVCQQVLGVGLEESRHRFSTLESEILDCLDRTSKLHERHSSWLENNQSDSNTLRDTLGALTAEAKELLTNIKVRKESVIFANEAKLQEERASIWFGLFLVISFGLVVYAIQFLPVDLASTQLTEVVAKAISRLIVFSVASFALFFLLKNYSACLHNATVNRHREHALDTFKYFRDAADDDEPTRRQILLETTKVIFTPVSSGYLKSAGESTPPNQIVEVISHLTKSGDHQ